MAVAHPYDLPTNEQAEARSIAGSKHSDSFWGLTAHWLALTVGYQL